MMFRAEKCTGIEGGCLETAVREVSTRPAGAAIFTETDSELKGRSGPVAALTARSPGVVELGDDVSRDEIAEEEFSGLGAELGLLAGLAEAEQKHRSLGRESPSQMDTACTSRDEACTSSPSSVESVGCLSYHGEPQVSSDEDNLAEDDDDDDWMELEDSGDDMDPSKIAALSSAFSNHLGTPKHHTKNHSGRAQPPPMGQYLLPLVSSGDLHTDLRRHFLVRNHDILQVLSCAGDFAKVGESMGRVDPADLTARMLQEYQAIMMSGGSDPVDLPPLPDEASEGVQHECPRCLKDDGQFCSGTRCTSSDSALDDVEFINIDQVRDDNEKSQNEFKNQSDMRFSLPPDIVIKRNDDPILGNDEDDEIVEFDSNAGPSEEVSGFDRKVAGTLENRILESRWKLREVGEVLVKRSCCNDQFLANGGICEVNGCRLQRSFRSAEQSSLKNLIKHLAESEEESPRRLAERSRGDGFRHDRDDSAGDTPQMIFDCDSVNTADRFLGRKESTELCPGGCANVGPCRRYGKTLDTANSEEESTIAQEEERARGSERELKLLDLQAGWAELRVLLLLGWHAAEKRYEPEELGLGLAPPCHCCHCALARVGRAAVLDLIADLVAQVFGSSEGEVRAERCSCRRRRARGVGQTRARQRPDPKCQACSGARALLSKEKRAVAERGSARLLQRLQSRGSPAACCCRARPPGQRDSDKVTIFFRDAPPVHVDLLTHEPQEESESTTAFFKECHEKFLSGDLQDDDEQEPPECARCRCWCSRPRYYTPARRQRRIVEIIDNFTRLSLRLLISRLDALCGAVCARHGARLAQLLAAGAGPSFLQELTARSMALREGGEQLRRALGPPRRRLATFCAALAPHRFHRHWGGWGARAAARRVTQLCLMLARGQDAPAAAALLRHLVNWLACVAEAQALRSDVATVLQHYRQRCERDDQLERAREKFLYIQEKYLAEARKLGFLQDGVLSAEPSDLGEETGRPEESDESVDPVFISPQEMEATVEFCSGEDRYEQKTLQRVRALVETLLAANESDEALQNLEDILQRFEAEYEAESEDSVMKMKGDLIDEVFEKVKGSDLDFAGLLLPEEQALLESLMTQMKLDAEGAAISDCGKALFSDIETLVKDVGSLCRKSREQGDGDAEPADVSSVEEFHELIESKLIGRVAISESGDRLTDGAKSRSNMEEGDSRSDNGISESGVDGCPEWKNDFTEDVADHISVADHRARFIHMKFQQNHYDLLKKQLEQELTRERDDNKKLKAQKEMLMEKLGNTPPARIYGKDTSAPLAEPLGEQTRSRPSKRKLKPPTDCNDGVHPHGAPITPPRRADTPCAVPAAPIENTDWTIDKMFNVIENSFFWRNSVDNPDCINSLRSEVMSLNRKASTWKNQKGSFGTVASKVMKHKSGGEDVKVKPFKFVSSRDDPEGEDSSDVKSVITAGMFSSNLKNVIGDSISNFEPVSSDGLNLKFSPKILPENVENFSTDERSASNADTLYRTDQFCLETTATDEEYERIFQNLKLREVRKKVTLIAPDASAVQVKNKPLTPAKESNSADISDPPIALNHIVHKNDKKTSASKLIIEKKDKCKSNEIQKDTDTSKQDSSKTETESNPSDEVDHRLLEALDAIKNLALEGDTMLLSDGSTVKEVSNNVSAAFLKAIGDPARAHPHWEFHLKDNPESIKYIQQQIFNSKMASVVPSNNSPNSKVALVPEAFVVGQSSIDPSIEVEVKNPKGTKDGNEYPEVRKEVKAPLRGYRAKLATRLGLEDVTIMTNTKDMSLRASSAVEETENSVSSPPLLQMSPTCPEPQPAYDAALNQNKRLIELNEMLKSLALQKMKRKSSEKRMQGNKSTDIKPSQDKESMAEVNLIQKALEESKRSEGGDTPILAELLDSTNSVMLQEKSLLQDLMDNDAEFASKLEAIRLKEVDSSGGEEAGCWWHSPPTPKKRRVLDDDANLTEAGEGSKKTTSPDWCCKMADLAGSIRDFPGNLADVADMRLLTPDTVRQLKEVRRARVPKKLGPCERRPDTVSEDLFLDPILDAIYDPREPHPCDPTQEEVMVEMVKWRDVKNGFTKEEFEMLLFPITSVLLFDKVRAKLTPTREELDTQPREPSEYDVKVGKVMDGCCIDDYWHRIKSMFPAWRSIAVKQYATCSANHGNKSLEIENEEENEFETDTVGVTSDSDRGDEKMSSDLSAREKLKNAVRKCIVDKVNNVKGNGQKVPCSVAEQSLLFVEKLQAVNKNNVEKLLKDNFTGEDWILTMNELQQLEKKLKWAVEYNKATTPNLVTTRCPEEAREAELLAGKGLSKLINQSSKKTEPIPKSTTTTNSDRDKELCECKTLKTEIIDPKNLPALNCSVLAGMDPFAIREMIQGMNLGCRSAMKYLMPTKIAFKDTEEEKDAVKEEPEPEESEVSAIIVRDLLEPQAAEPRGRPAEVTVLNGVALKDGLPIRDGVTIRDIIGIREPTVPDAHKTHAPATAKQKLAKSCEGLEAHHQHVCQVNHGEVCGAEEGRCSQHPDHQPKLQDHPCNCCYCTVFGHAPPVTTPVSRNFNETRERLRSILNRKKQRSRPVGNQQSSDTESSSEAPKSPAVPLPPPAPPTVKQAPSPPEKQAQAKQAVPALVKPAVAPVEKPAAVSATTAKRPQPLPGTKLSPHIGKPPPGFELLPAGPRRGPHSPAPRPAEVPKVRPEAAPSAPLEGTTPPPQAATEKPVAQVAPNRVPPSATPRPSAQKVAPDLHPRPKAGGRPAPLPDSQTVTASTTTTTSRDSSVFSTSSVCSGCSGYRARPEDTRDLNMLVEFIEGPGRTVDKIKKQAKKARQRAKKLIDRLMCEQEELRNELLSLSNEANSLKDEAGRQERELAAALRKKPPTKKGKKNEAANAAAGWMHSERVTVLRRDAREASNRATQAGELVDTARSRLRCIEIALLRLAETQGNEKPSPPQRQTQPSEPREPTALSSPQQNSETDGARPDQCMVTIKRVMLPDRDEPSVTITARPLFAYRQGNDCLPAVVQESVPEPTQPQPKKSVPSWESTLAQINALSQAKKKPKANKQDAKPEQKKQEQNNKKTSANSQQGLAPSTRDSSASFLVSRSASIVSELSSIDLNTATMTNKQRKLAEKLKEAAERTVRQECEDREVELSKKQLKKAVKKVLKDLEDKNDQIKEDKSKNKTDDRDKKLTKVDAKKDMKQQKDNNKSAAGPAAKPEPPPPTKAIKAKQSQKQTKDIKDLPLPQNMGVTVKKLPIVSKPAPTKAANKSAADRSVKLNPDTTIEIANKQKEAPKAARPGPTGAVSCSIMEQLQSGVPVGQLRLPPGITLTSVDPSRQPTSIAPKSAIPSVKLTTVTPPVNRPTPPQAPPPALIMVETSRLQAQREAKAQLASQAQVDSQSNAVKSKKSKKKGKKIQNHTRPAGNTTSTHSHSRPPAAAEETPKMVTLRNPMFHPHLPAAKRDAIRIPDPIPMPPNACQATITPTSNGMFTIRNPLMSMMHQQSMMRPPDTGPVLLVSDRRNHALGRTHLAYSEKPLRADKDSSEPVAEITARIADFGFNNTPKRTDNKEDGFTVNLNFTPNKDRGYSLFKSEDNDGAGASPSAANASPFGTRAEQAAPSPIGSSRGADKRAHDSPAARSLDFGRPPRAPELGTDMYCALGAPEDQGYPERQTVWSPAAQERSTHDSNQRQENVVEISLVSDNQHHNLAHQQHAQYRAANYQAVGKQWGAFPYRGDYSNQAPYYQQPQQPQQLPYSQYQQQQFSQTNGNPMRSSHSSSSSGLISGSIASSGTSSVYDSVSNSSSNSPADSTVIPAPESNDSNVNLFHHQNAVQRPSPPETRNNVEFGSFGMHNQQNAGFNSQGMYGRVSDSPGNQRPSEMGNMSGMRMTEGQSRMADMLNLQGRANDSSTPGQMMQNHANDHTRMNDLSNNFGLNHISDNFNAPQGMIPDYGMLANQARRGNDTYATNRVLKSDGVGFNSNLRQPESLGFPGHRRSAMDSLGGLMPGRALEEEGRFGGFGPIGGVSGMGGYRVEEMRSGNSTLGAIGSHRVSNGVSREDYYGDSRSVFAPDQSITNLNELESTERDIESFKRFDFYFEPPKQRPKISLNLQDLALAKPK